jgi:uncharacterized membrane protein
MPQTAGTVKSNPPAADAVPASISQNIEAMGDYYKREARRIGPAQRLLERIGDAIGRPAFLGLVLIFVGLWISINMMPERFGMVAFDAPPFSGLQTIVSLAALLITTVVLIGQNRLAKLEQRRGEMELQVNILTEQKTTTLIRLLEELRRDLPMVPDRHDPDAATYQQPTDATQIMTALEKDRQPGKPGTKP